MSIAYTDTQHYSDIADAIRAKNGSADTYTPSEMATAITDLPTPQTYDYLVSYEKHDVTIPSDLTLGNQFIPYLVTPFQTSDNTLYQIFQGVASNNNATGSQVFKGITGGGWNGGAVSLGGVRGQAGTTENDIVRGLDSTYGFTCTAGTTVHLEIFTFKKFPNQ